MPRATAVSADARRTNAALIFERLLDHGPCSRKAIREATGLVSGTVTAIVAELIARGLVRETGELVVTGGRPRRILDLVPGRVLGAAAAVTKDRVGVELVDLGGRTRWSASTPHRGAVEGAAPLVAALAGLLDDAHDAADGVPGAWYSGAVVAVPGLVVGDDRLLITLEMPLRDLALVEQTGSRLRRPQSIRLLNSGRTAALAEWAALPPAGRPRLMAYVTSLAHGVSGGLVEDGRLVGGEHGLAGEVGHIVVDALGEPCECGARGCLTTLLATDRLLLAAGVPAGEVSALGEGGIDRLVRLLEDCNAPARAAVERAAFGLAAATATLSNLTDVGLVVMGGHLLALRPWIGGVVTEVLESRARVNAVFNPRVREGGAAEDTVRAGMVQALRSRVGADPLAVPVVA